jgi:hypothetical protein
MALRLDLEGGGALRASGGGWIDSLARGGRLGGDGGASGRFLEDCSDCS